MRVVVAHDYLTQRGGAERVVLSLLEAFPGARLVTSVYSPERTFPEFREYEIETILPRSMPFVGRDPRLAFPLLALAFQRHCIGNADVVICSSSGWAHGVSARAPKLVYCHTPARWLHEPDDYLTGQSLPVRLAALVAHRPLRRWDAAAAASAAAYVANSTTVARRIRRVYGREAEVVHPAVTIDPHAPQQPVEVPHPAFFLTVSRPRGYKHGQAVEAAASAAGVPLVATGSASARQSRSTVTHVGRPSDAALRWLYANCRALVAASHEDFGLTPIEAMAFGKPVIALRAGGYLDSVVEGVTGLFFDRPEPTDIAEALRAFDERAFDSETIIEHARQFAPDRFASRINSIADRVSEQGRRQPR